MHVIPTNYPVSDYCKEMGRKEIIVNRAWQRSDKVWPPAARSFLIETILLDYPIPKLSLYQVTDVKSRQTYKEIVDGQQRSQAIFDFYNDKLALSSKGENPETAGKLYSQLDEEYQHQFLGYSLSVDLLVSATPDQIREVFRRINSYTVPLNPEEKRHSIYQGVFKWFIYKLSKTYDQSFFDLGVFGEKQLVRMADAKLFSELIHGLLYGISTTNVRKLDNLYSTFDRSFALEEEIQDRVEEAMSLVIDLEEIHKGSLMKPYNLYCLLLAICHARKPMEQLMSVHEPVTPYRYDRNIVVANLTTLAESLEYPEQRGRFRQFVSANLSKTNVAAHREIRLKWFCKALEPDLM